MKKADGICPFCHKLLDHDFEKEIRDCFDEAYQDSVDAIATFQSAYTSYTTEMLGVLDENLSNDFPPLDLEMYKEKLERLRTIIQSNLQVSQKKVEKPAVPVKLQDIQSLVDELDEIIVFGNKLIQANNDAFNKKRETKVQCNKMLWEHLAFLVKDEVADACAKDKEYAETLVRLDKEKRGICQGYLDKDSEMKAENGKTVNTDAA